MLLANVTTKTVRDRTPLATWVGLGLAIMTFVMFWAGEAMGDELSELIDDMPEALTGILGGSSSNYVVTEIFGIIGPVGVLAIAIGGGINALAKEEDARTADLLLTQPVSRREVVLSKAAVMVSDTFIATVMLMIGGMAGAMVFDITGVAVADVVAASVHLFFLGLAFGMFSLAVGNSTGSASAGMAAAAGLAVVSNLAAGLIPLIDGAEELVKISPWYYFNGSEPLANGVALDHLAVLSALASISFAIAVWVVEHRDISSGRTAHKNRIPALGLITRPRLDTVFAKTLSERVTLIAIVGGSLAAMAILMSVMFNGIEDALIELNDAFPESVMSLIGTEDLSTPAGWMQAEMLSLVTPLAFVAVGIIMGANAIAGQDAKRTLNLLVMTPIKRSRIVIDQALATAAVIAILALITWLGLVLGSALAGLDLSTANLAAAVAHQAMLGVFFGMVGLAIGAFASNTTTIRLSMAIAVATFFANFIFGQLDSLAGAARLTPWYYASEAEALFNGVDFVHLGVLAVTSLLAVFAAVWLFERREISA